jgi:organic hydroperoxide reductase OsmC/OhrA
MGKAAATLNVKLPSETTVDTEIDLCNSDGEYFLQARLTITLPGLDQEVAKRVADAAHQTCPYSKATRGNISVTISVA